MVCFECGYWLNERGLKLVVWLIWELAGVGSLRSVGLSCIGEWVVVGLEVLMMEEAVAKVVGGFVVEFVVVW